MTPYILLGRKELRPESAPLPEHVYDEHRQLWIDKRSGIPLVSCLRSTAKPTEFGETTLTQTREGADQPQRTSLQASEFGETTHTRSREGVDQVESASLQASQLGETTMTKTREGIDQTEGVNIQAGFNAPYSHF